ncbi:MAG: hypothetical protein IKU34_02680 [Clostridia bacterium]|nr:hypothetical protein [Clostridia bacterium]
MKKTLLAAGALLLAVLFALFFLGSNSPLGPAIGSDNAIYLTMGTALKNGYAPYTQVFDHKGPLLFFLEMLAQLFTGGYSTTGVFVLETLFIWGSLVCIGAAARRMNAASLPAQMIFLTVIAPVIDGGNYCEGYSNLLTLLGALLLMRVFDRDELVKEAKAYFLPSLLYGALLMISFLIRANNMLPMAGMLLGAALLLLAKKHFAQLGVCAAGFLAGCAAAALPVALWLLAQGALGEAVYGAFVHNMMYAETDGGSRVGMLLHDRYGWRAMFMAALACAGGMAYAIKKRRPVVALMMIFGAAAGGFAAFISHKFYSHYLMLGAPLCALGTAMLFASIRGMKRSVLCAAALVLCAACAVQLVHFGIIENNERRQAHEVYTTLEKQTQELLAHVPMEERDELLAYRTEPKWYVAARAMPYLRFYFLQEILAQADPAVMDEIVKTLESDPPKWLVIYYNREFGPPYDARVAEIFETDYEFVDARGEYQLLRRKEEKHD